MHIVVLVVGLMAAVAGLTAVVFGFSIKEFTFGSTLLITGTTTLVGGLLMIAVAGAIRELNRIAKALSRPAPAPRFPRPGEPFDPYAPGSFRPGMAVPRPPGAPMPPAPMPPPQAGSPEPPARDVRPREPRLDASAAAEEAKLEAHAPVEPVPELREPASPSLLPDDQAAVEQPTELDEPEAVPLSPHEMPRAPAFETPGEVPESSPEPETDEAQPAVQDEPASEAWPEEPAPPEPSSGERARPSPFDAIWPPGELPPVRRFADTEPDDMAPRRDEAASFEQEADMSPTTAPAAAPAESWQPEDQAAEPKPADVDERGTQGEAPHAVSILKSGVVDGMAYTLYSDGSIEAQMPSGTIRFASINELRLHLEKTE